MTDDVGAHYAHKVFRSSFTHRYLTCASGGCNALRLQRNASLSLRAFLSLTHGACTCAQVFDLSKHKPHNVLSRMWANFDAAEASGDPAARIYQKRLRILVAGGDGTIAWWVGL